MTNEEILERRAQIQKKLDYHVTEAIRADDMWRNQSEDCDQDDWAWWYEHHMNRATFLDEALGRLIERVQ